MSATAWANINLPTGHDNTYQEWTFSTNPNGPNPWTQQVTDIVADAGYTSPGIPTADVLLTGPIMPQPGWYETSASGHTGLIRGKDATIDLHIPNVIRPPTWVKIIQVEVTYYVKQYEPGVHGYIDALSYVAAGGNIYTSTSKNDEHIAGTSGWGDVTIEWRIPQIYNSETIRLNFVDSGVYIDKIVAATVCIPEPATLLLLGGAGLVGLLRRRRAF